MEEMLLNEKEIGQRGERKGRRKTLLEITEKLGRKGSEKRRNKIEESIMTFITM